MHTDLRKAICLSHKKKVGGIKVWVLWRNFPIFPSMKGPLVLMSKEELSLSHTWHDSYPIPLPPKGVVRQIMKSAVQRITSGSSV